MGKKCDLIIPTSKGKVKSLEFHFHHVPLPSITIVLSLKAKYGAQTFIPARQKHVRNYNEASLFLAALVVSEET